MRDDDSFRLFTPDDAVGAAMVLVVLLSLGGVFVPEKAAPAPVAAKNCEVTVVQYGPGEPHTKKGACARFAEQVPNHILIHPVAEAHGPR